MSLVKDVMSESKHLTSKHIGMQSARDIFSGEFKMVYLSDSSVIG